jgi:glycosyltransferase involved in cell wall biosynthesis
VTGAPAPEVAPAKPRLLVLTSTFPRWAGDREPPFVYELSRRLAGQFEVHVLAPHAAGAQRAETLDGTHVHRFRYAPERLQQLAYDGGILARLRERRWRWLLVPCLLVAQGWALRRLMGRHRFDVIHAHWIVPQGLVAVLAGATRHAPMLCTSHGGDLFGLRGRILGRLKRYVLSRCAAVTVVSEAMREEVQRLNPGQGVDVIPMGTDLTERFTPSRAVAREAGGVLFAGRLVEKKGVRHLLDAIARLHGQGRALTLRIAGSGPDLDMLRDEARRLGIVDRVEFLGSVDHARLAVLFRAATAAVVPSVVASDGDQEGFGLVIVEAMGCGCPVIASRLPAIGDIATDGETAMLVPPADPDALARAIAAVLDDPHGAEKRATAARARVVELFDWAVISRRYADLLGQLVGRPRPGSGH